MSLKTVIEIGHEELLLFESSELHSFELTNILKNRKFKFFEVLLYNMCFSSREVKKTAFYSGIAFFSSLDEISIIFRTLVKSAYQKINFLISQPKQMLWVLKRTVLMRLFF